MPNINIHNADVIEYLKNYSGPKFHSVISDPPYGLAFMGKTWDKFTPIQYQNWVTEWASLLLNHLYPGAVCMFFGGTRTYHRLATGLEDAGFEIFDSMIWCYGSGFPKSYNISKWIDKEFGLEREILGEIKGGGRLSGNSDYQSSDYGKSWNGIKITNPVSDLAHQYNGYGTALKPAFEPIVLCRKPRGKETFVDCALNYGSGSLNVDGSRIPTQDNWSNHSQYSTPNTNNGYKRDSHLKEITKQSNDLGRFPANLGLICDCEKEHCECIEKELDSQSGKTGGHKGTYLREKTERDGFIYGDSKPHPKGHELVNYDDKGGASRFFYTAKSSRKERNLGLDHLPTVLAGGMSARQDGSLDGHVVYAKNNHPTVKPIKLIEYLATMLKPPVEDSSILIPFSGSGSEIIGAMFAGWNIINAIEIDENYCNIAKNRVDYWKQFSTYDKGLKGKQG